jgi:uncharacterized protein DUF4384/putative zinc finger protein
MMPHGEHCPSDLSLDRWLAGELTPAEARAWEDHLASCASCQGRRAALLEARHRFAREAPPFASLAAAAQAAPPSGPAPRSGLVPRSRRTPPLAWLAGGCGLAAAALIALAIGEPWRTPSDGPGTFGTRTKGGPASLGWVVRRGERVFAGRPEQRLRPGDAVRFTITVREPVFVAVIGLDASGKANVYYPEAGQLARLEAGSDQPLPAAIELDATPGDERLYAVFCESAVPIARVTEAVERSPDAPALPPGCSGERHRLQRESP